MSSFLFLLTDDIHIHARNFGPLFRYIESRKVETVVHAEHTEIKQRQGNYAGMPALERYLPRLEGLDADALFALTHDYKGAPLRLFPMCRAEALTYALATRDHWHEQPVAAGEREAFTRLYERDRDVLLSCMAATMFWIDEYEIFLTGQPVPFTHAFVFSGSMIYTRTLMAIMRFNRTKVFVLESTFTGKEFYFEERYGPIANASDIRFPTVRDAISLPGDPVARMRETGKAIRKLGLSKNKNVEQPDVANIPAFAEPERPMLLVIGQVVNDFSIIEQRRGYLSSISFYQELIRRALEETDYNIVFKGHPWEHHKFHLCRPLTKQSLTFFRDRLPEELRARFALREHDNITLLGREVERVALLNSQAGVELAFYCGLRPSTFGAPYYGGAGFTDNYATIDAFLADVAQGRTQALLDLDGYEALLEWLTRFLQYHVITERASGLREIQSRLERSAEIGAAAPQLVPRSAPSKASLQMAIERAFGDRAWRKLRKLGRDPRAFLRDAKIVRTLRRR